MTCEQLDELLERLDGGMRLFVPSAWVEGRLAHDRRTRDLLLTMQAARRRCSVDVAHPDPRGEGVGFLFSPWPSEQAATASRESPGGGL